jgi:hypothetical protein
VKKGFVSTEFDEVDVSPSKRDRLDERESEMRQEGIGIGDARSPSSELDEGRRNKEIGTILVLEAFRRTKREVFPSRFIGFTPLPLD